MNKNNIFTNIITKKVQSKIVYQDEEITAFHDINPIAPIHILIVPNILITSINEININNKNLFGNMLYVAVKIAKKLKINKKGYRLIINCNEYGRQEIPHVHLHLLGGKKLNQISI